MSERENDVPDWLLERLAMGELSVSEAARVRALLASAGQGKRLDALQLSNQVILAAHPAEIVAAEIRRRLTLTETRRTLERKPKFRLTAPLLAAGAAAGLVAMLLPLETNRVNTDASSGDARHPETMQPGITATPSDTIRPKGLVPHLAIYKKTADGAALLSDGSPVLPGDVIQVAYVAAGYHYGVVASIDGQRAVTLHLPENPGPAVALNVQGETALNHAFELDDTAGHERFIFVTSHQPFATDSVIDALRAGDSLPPAFVTTELSLEKSLP